MELKKGYKQTEIGVIPESWELKKIYEFASINGRVGWKGYTKKDLVENGPYAIGAKHINKDNKLDLSEPTCLSYEKFAESPEIKVFINDILIVQRGTIGKLVFIDREIGDATINPSMLILRSKNASQSYIYYFLNSFEGQKQIILDTSSTGVPMITQKQVLNFKIPLPTFSEQQAIATVLSDTDQLIQNLKILIIKKKAIKQGAMQELLTGKKRLKGFTEEWETKKLGSSGKTISGLSGKTKTDFGSGNARYITFMNVMSNVVIDTSILEKVNIKQGETQNTFKKGDLFFNTSSETPEEVGMCAVLLDDIQDVYLNSFCFGYRLNNEELNGLYLSYLINSNVGRSIFESLAQGATRYNLSKTNFNNVILNVPKDIKEQQAIAQILSDMDAEIVALEQQLHKTQALKQGMMQELLTGKTRLVQPSYSQYELSAIAAEPKTSYTKNST